MWRDLNAGLWCWTHVFIPPSSTSTFKCTTGIHPVNLCGAIRVLMTAGLKIKIRSLYSRIIMTKWSQTTSSEWKMVQEAKKALTLSCCSTAGKKSPSTAKQCESVNSERLWCLRIMQINLGFDRRQFMGRLRKQATRKNIEFQERNMWKMIVKVYC